MGGWLAQCADLLNPLYVAAKKLLLGSKVIGTDDTSVKVLDRCESSLFFESEKPLDRNSGSR